MKLEDAQDAKPLAKALCDGGLPCAEVTFRTEPKTNAEKLLFNSDNLLIGNKGVTSYLSLANFNG